MADIQETEVSIKTRRNRGGGGVLWRGHMFSYFQGWNNIRNIGILECKMAHYLIVHKSSIYLEPIYPTHPKATLNKGTQNYIKICIK